MYYTACGGIHARYPRLIPALKLLNYKLGCNGIKKRWCERSLLGNRPLSDFLKK
jgi:hypothetical protein